jgi:peptide/nickel transport system substrate-binding protein
MKRTMSVLAAAVALVLPAAGCGSTKKSTNDTTPTTSASTTTSAEGTGASTTNASTAPSASTAAPTTVPAKPTGTLKMAQAFDHVTWFPHSPRANLTEIAGWRLLYDSLFTVEDGELKGFLVESWTSEPQKVVLKLRTDVKFSDGSPLTADDVVANLEYVRKGPLTARTYAVISNVAATDANTVTIDLSSPSPNLMRNLQGINGLVVPKKMLDNPAIEEQPIGSGPYMLNPGASVDNQKYAFDLNPTYWNPKLQGVEKVELFPLLNEAARLNALQSGQVDVAAFETSVAAQLAKNNDFESVKVPRAIIQLVVTDRMGTKHPALGNVKVRQALGYALNRKAIVEGAMRGIGEPTGAATLPSQIGYDKSLEDLSTFDLAKAKQLMTEAGYPDGFTMQIGMLPIFQQYLESIAEQWKAIGVKLELVATDPSQAREAIATPKYPIVFLQGNSSAAWDAAQFIVGPGLLNTWKASDPAAEEASKALLNSVAEADQVKAANRFLTELVTGGIVIPIARGQATAIYRKDKIAGGIQWVYDADSDPIVATAQMKS